MLSGKQGHIDVAYLTWAGQNILGSIALALGNAHGVPQERHSIVTVPAPNAEGRSGFVELSVPQAPVEDFRGVARAEDGFFYVVAKVNGAPVRFLVDTGASMVVLTRADAKRAGVLPDERAFSERADSAAGKTAMARVQLDNVSTRWMDQRNLSAAVASEGLSVSLLGQNWLSQLESIQIRKDRMVFN
jgi:aspartyl protease family protein